MQINSKTKQQGYKETELGFLPESWEIQTFEKCIVNKRIKVGKVKQQKYKKEGKFPIVDQGQNKIAGYWDKQEDVYQGTLPIIVFGDHTRIVKFVDFSFVCGADGTKVIIPDESNVKPNFFYYALLNIEMPSRGYNRHYSLLREKKIPFPPLQEQQKIAHVLSTIQESKEKTENVIHALKELKKSMMKHLFTYGPVPVDEADSVPLKETEIGKVPEGWEVVKLEEICDLNKKTVLPKDSKTNVYVGLEHIDPGISQLRRYGNKSEVRSSKYLFKEGHVLYGKLRPYLDKAVLSNTQGICSTDILVFKAKEDKTTPEFLVNLLHTKEFLNVSISTMAGTNHPRTSWSKLKNLNFQLPSVSIQKQIASILSAVDEKIEKEENKKNALDELFKSMLQDLMSAKVRVDELDFEGENG